MHRENSNTSKSFARSAPLNYKLINIFTRILYGNFTQFLFYVTKNRPKVCRKCAKHRALKFALELFIIVRIAISDM